MFPSGPLDPPAGKPYLPTYPRLPRQFGDLLEQTTVEVLSGLYPGLEIRKRVGQIMVTAYFEQPGFSKPIRWAVACVMTPQVERSPADLWGRYEQLVSSNEVDRVLLVTEHEVNAEARALMQSLQGMEHVTVRRLQAMLADSKPKRGSRKRVPAAGRFVRVDHNGPEVYEARVALSDLAAEVEQSTTLPLPAEEREALAQEILILVGMLQQRVIRLAQVQFAISHDGVLGYLKGNFASDVRAGAVGAAIGLLLKALGIDKP